MEICSIVDKIVNMYLLPFMSFCIFELLSPFRHKNGFLILMIFLNLVDEIIVFV